MGILCFQQPSAEVALYILRASNALKSLLEQGMEPNVVTDTCSSTACSHASLADERQQYFHTMEERHDNPETLKLVTL